MLSVSIVALGSVVATALIASSAAARAGLHRQLTALGVANVAITAAVDVPAAGPTGIVTHARRAEAHRYFFRATHDVTVAAKQLAEGFFGQGKVRRAHFNGCSNGGRMALQEVSRFPDDFEGIHRWRSLREQPLLCRRPKF